ncbi:hypothetical protein GGX14DRAFT_645121 [Mycena pura]|uniref:Uncharacterized protein n=1 Tax=Mycena pura TaxID=153505 RepID=A0AAD6YEA0_9AGAR|nr:hypothetical protein GGX14DRAFT_645121 [Mycena pura]
MRSLFALIVGIDQYQSNEVSNLQGCVRNAETMRNALQYAANSQCNLLAASCITSSAIQTAFEAQPINQPSNLLHNVHVAVAGRQSAPAITENALWISGPNLESLFSPLELVPESFELRTPERVSRLPRRFTWWKQKTGEDGRWDKDEPAPTFLRRRDSQREADGWKRTREVGAFSNFSVLVVLLFTMFDPRHGLLKAGTAVSKFIPVPGLNVAANLLLGIWDNLQGVETNRQECLSLAQRCAELLLSIQKELVEIFTRVRDLLLAAAQGHFLKRYFRREEISREIASCNASISDALTMFSLSVQMRILKRVTEPESRGHAQQDVRAIIISQAELAALSREHKDSPPVLGLPPFPVPPRPVAHAECVGNRCSLCRNLFPEGTEIEILGIVEVHFFLPSVDALRLLTMGQVTPHTQQHPSCRIQESTT